MKKTKVLGILLLLALLVAASWFLVFKEKLPEDVDTSVPITPTELSKEESIEVINKAFGRVEFEGTFQEQIDGLDSLDRDSTSYSKYLDDIVERCVDELSLECANILISYADANGEAELRSVAYSTRGNIYAILGDNSSAQSDYQTSFSLSPVQEGDVPENEGN